MNETTSLEHDLLNQIVGIHALERHLKKDSEQRALGRLNSRLVRLAAGYLAGSTSTMDGRIQLAKIASDLAIVCTEKPKYHVSGNRQFDIEMIQ